MKRSQDVIAALKNQTERIMDRIKTAPAISTDETLINEDHLTNIQEFVIDQNHCCLCGSELNFTHKIDHLELTIVEDAKCNSCHISLRTRSFLLQ